MSKKIQKYFDFATALEGLKKIERFKGQYYWRDYPQPDHYESVADHSWRLAMLVILFKDKLSQPFDLEKALKFAVLHDLPEILAGDSDPIGSDGTGRNTYAFREDLKKEKNNKELKAAKELFSLLDKDKKNELLEDWLDYESKRSFEARIVKALDKIECLLQIWEYRHGNVFKESLIFDENYTMKFCKVDPVLEEFALYILNLMKKNYKEYKVA